MASTIDYFKNFINGIKNNVSLYDSLIEMFYDINNDYTELVNELIHSKPQMEEFNYKAHIYALLHDLENLDIDAFNKMEIDKLFFKYDVEEVDFLKWYNLIPQNNNDLYEILALDKYTLNIEEYHGDSIEIKRPFNIESKIIIKNLSLYRENLKEEYPILNNYEIEEIKYIQWNFGKFIQHHYYDLLYYFLLNENGSSIKKEPKVTLSFQIGLKFAQGIPQAMYKNGQSFRSIAKDLNFKDTNNNYFSQTYNNTKGSDKNIYLKKNITDLIIEYCKENNINIVDDFIDEINKNQQKLI